MAGFGIQRCEEHCSSGFEADCDPCREELKQIYNASRPAEQFRGECMEEFARLQATGEEMHPHIDASLFARFNIEARWREEKISDSLLEDSPSWKHELTTSSGVDSDSQALDEHDSSRPICRFIFAVCKVQQYLNTLPEDEGDEAELQFRRPAYSLPSLPYAPQYSYVVSYEAYIKVRLSWMKRGLWDRSWGELPGRSWKHEQRLEDFIQDEIEAAAEESDDEGSVAETVRSADLTSS